MGKTAKQREVEKVEKNELEAYALEKFGVDLNKAKSVKNLKLEIAELEAKAKEEADVAEALNTEGMIEQKVHEVNVEALPEEVEKVEEKVEEIKATEEPVVEKPVEEVVEQKAPVAKPVTPAAKVEQPVETPAVEAPKKSRGVQQMEKAIIVFTKAKQKIPTHATYKDKKAMIDALVVIMNIVKITNDPEVCGVVFNFFLKNYHGILAEGVGLQGIKTLPGTTQQMVSTCYILLKLAVEKKMNLPTTPFDLKAATAILGPHPLIDFIAKLG